MNNEVPWLRSGIGETPADGGCILQVLDWIDRNKWTDSPPCVHSVIATAAIRVNDNCSDSERQKLLDLAPRIMGTTNTDSTISVKLAIFCAEKVLHIFEDKYPADLRPRNAIKAAKAANAAANAAYAAANAAATYATETAAAYAANAATGIEFLISLVDEYDRLTNRKSVNVVTNWDSVIEVMNAK